MQFLFDDSDSDRVSMAPVPVVDMRNTSRTDTDIFDIPRTPDPTMSPVSFSMPVHTKPIVESLIDRRMKYREHRVDIKEKIEQRTQGMGQLGSVPGTMATDLRVLVLRNDPRSQRKMLSMHTRSGHPLVKPYQRESRLEGGE
jgi:hypothetical protein